jgi:hypothetical protein
MYWCRPDCAAADWGEAAPSETPAAEPRGGRVSTVRGAALAAGACDQGGGWTPSGAGALDEAGSSLGGIGAAAAGGGASRAGRTVPATGPLSCRPQWSQKSACSGRSPLQNGQFGSNQAPQRLQ